MSAGCSAKTRSMSTANKDQNISACSTSKSLNHAKACVEKQQIIYWFQLAQIQIWKSPWKLRNRQPCIDQALTEIHNTNSGNEVSQKQGHTDKQQQNFDLAIAHGDSVCLECRVVTDRVSQSAPVSCISSFLLFCIDC